MELHRALRAAAPRRENAPVLDELVGRALAYYRDFVKPAKAYRAAGRGRAAGAGGAGRLARAVRAARRRGRPTQIAEAIQQEVYEIGKRHGFADDLRAWFRALYEILLGQSEGPRFGSFVAYYGPAETAALIRQRPGRPPARPAGRLSAAPWHRPQRAPGGAGRARPGAGRGAAVRRHVRRPSGARRPEPARSRLRPPAAHHHAAPARPDRRAARRASCATAAEARSASAICCVWAPRSCCSWTRRRMRRSPRPWRSLRAPASLARRASPTPCCAASRATARRLVAGQDAAAPQHAGLALGVLARGLRRGAHASAIADGASGRAAARPDRPAGRRAAGRAARCDEDLRPYGAARRRAARSRSCRATARAPGGCRMRRPPCRRACCGDVAGRQVIDLCAAPGGKTAQLGRGRRQGDRARGLGQARRAAAQQSRRGCELEAEVVVADALEWRPPRPAGRRAARCALHRDRHDPPPPRHRLAQDAGRRGADGRAAGPAARSRRRDGEAGRPRGLRQLLAAARGGAAGRRRRSRGGPAGRAAAGRAAPSWTAWPWTSPRRATCARCPAIWPSRAASTASTSPACASADREP